MLQQAETANSFTVQSVIAPVWNSFTSYGGSHKVYSSCHEDYSDCHVIYSDCHVIYSGCHVIYSGCYEDYSDCHEVYSGCYRSIAACPKAARNTWASFTSLYQLLLCSELQVKQGRDVDLGYFQCAEQDYKQYGQTGKSQRLVGATLTNKENLEVLLIVEGQCWLSRNSRDMACNKHGQQNTIESMKQPHSQILPPQHYRGTRLGMRLVVRLVVRLGMRLGKDYPKNSRLVGDRLLN